MQLPWEPTSKHHGLYIKPMVIKLGPESQAIVVSGIRLRFKGLGFGIWGLRFGVTIIQPAENISQELSM